MGCCLRGVSFLEAFPWKGRSHYNVSAHNGRDRGRVPMRELSEEESEEVIRSEPGSPIPWSQVVSYNTTV